MKIFLALIFSFYVLSSSFAGELACKSSSKVQGWVGNSVKDYIIVKAKFTDETLHRPKVRGAYVASLDEKNVLPAVKEENLLQYTGIEDSWNYFTLILPAKFMIKDSSESYVAHLHKVGEGERNKGIIYELVCKNK